MKSKRVMEIWQFIIIEVLCVVLLATMFIPAFNFTEKAAKKAAKATVDVLEDSTGIGDSFLGELLGDAATELAEESYTDAFANFVDDYKAEFDVDIETISPFKIMTHDLVPIDEEDADDEDDSSKKDDPKEASEGETTEETTEEKSDVRTVFEDLDKGFATLRVVLWIVYGLALVTMIVNILGFAFGWSKLIAVILDLVYGVIAAGMFGYLKFALMSSVVDKVEDALNDMLSGYSLGLGGLSDDLTKICSSVSGICFLVAFIVAIVFVIFNIVCIFVGGKREEGKESDTFTMAEDEFGFISNNMAPVPGGFNDNYSGASTIGAGSQHLGVEFGNGPADGGVTVAAQPYVPPVQKPVAPPAPPVNSTPIGRVQCVKGIANGKGYMLPGDKKVVVGKSATNANLVIANPNVSNIHCSIRYNPYNNTYIVKDHSMNGTFVQSKRLQRDYPTEFPAGTILSLADGKDLIKLG